MDKLVQLVDFDTKEELMEHILPMSVNEFYDFIILSSIPSGFSCPEKFKIPVNCSSHDDCKNCWLDTFQNLKGDMQVK